MILFLITDIISYFILFYLPSYYLWINRQPKPYSTYSYAYLVVSLIDHSPYIVDFRSAIWLPYDHRSVANTDTRFAPNILGRGCFISLWRPARTASALSGSQDAAWRKTWRMPSSVAHIGVDEFASYDTTLQLN